MKNQMKDKIIIVTGGAGQLGSALCSRLDELGNHVVMTDLDPVVCKKKIEELGLYKTVPLQLDVTDVTSINIAFKKVVNKFGKIDVLINNAGIGVFTPTATRTFEEFDRVMKVNVYGTFFCSQKALEYMEKQKSGCIVNIGSIYGIVSSDPRIYGNSGRNNSEVYSSSKAGVIQMTKYLAANVKCKDIRINCVSPGGIFNNQAKFFVKNYEHRTPMGRMAKPNDIVKAIIFLCSDEASYINGHNLVVDGGFTIW